MTSPVLQWQTRGVARGATLRVGMPHLNAGGLSEGWLFRHAGDALWQAIGAHFGRATHELRSEWGERLYPTFLAVRASYDAPLSDVRENQRLATEATLLWTARGYAHGTVALTSDRHRLTFEMLTMLAARSKVTGELSAARPSFARAKADGFCAEDAPELVGLAKAARNGQRHPDSFSGAAWERPLSPLGSYRYEPSPYSDFNGARLLYFASYVGIADTAERQIVQALGISSRGNDWALSTSTLRRDVFYYANIQLGDAITTHLLALEWSPRSTVKTHLRLVRESDGRTLADVVAEKSHDPSASSLSPSSEEGRTLSRRFSICAAR